MPESSPFQPSELKLENALAAFVKDDVPTQGSEHIKPVHWYIALRLVLEGGFAPDDITPRPPLVVSGSGRHRTLSFSAEARKDAELAVIGGLKSKKIDVVVTKPMVGPVLAISVKGTKRAFRNLTNRMEEAIGDSTNLHIMYPGLVYGFFHVLQMNREGSAGLSKPDVSVDVNGNVVKAVRRYHDVLSNLAGRRLVRDDYTQYEAVGFALVAKTADGASVFSGFPAASSPLAPAKFFQTLYEVYDLRFPYMSNQQGLARCSWRLDSPAFSSFPDEDAMIARLGYAPRIGIVQADDADDED